MSAPRSQFLDGRPRLHYLEWNPHGREALVLPSAYTPDEYAGDLARSIEGTGLVRPIVVGHSMGGISVLAFAAQFGKLARAAIAIDVAVTSTPHRDRLLTRLRKLPTVMYPDRATALSAFA
jgi:pimeloyl-ACP methyl ester carboxylesterase